MNDDLTRIEPDSTPAHRPASETRIGRLSDGAGDRNGDDAAAASGTLPLELGYLLRERFELVSVIGIGGTGVVYKALDHLNREFEDRDPYVAIKVLHERLKHHPNAFSTLQREVRKSQQLAHENIIGVHSFDRDGSVLYMTMELLDGQSLRDLIESNRQGLSPAEAVPMIRGMARALAYAHESGIVHSDFKPGNVFRTEQERIKVLDFGISRGAVAETPDEKPPKTLVGMTPAYASPQMLAGERPHPSDDVFALAIVAQELLTGRHPFSGGTADKTVLSERRIRLHPDLSWSQKRALRQAFSPDRESRQQNAGEFLRQFDGSAVLRAAVRTGIAAAAVVAVIAFAATRGADPRPAVPFDELPPETQSQFEAVLAEGETALRFGDSGINDAYFYFAEAYDLHPGNPRAIVGLETVAGRFLSSIRTADIQTQRDVFGLLYCQNYLRGYAPVTRSCKDLLGAECEAIASGCTSRPAD